MKKFLLSAGLFSLVLVGRSQVVLNEIYTDPGAGKHEFFELFNTSTNPNPESLDCYTIITWYKINATTSGFYVMDLPNLTIGPRSWFVGAAADPFNVQAQSNVDAAFSWNSMPAGGSLMNYQSVNGGAYTNPAIPANFNDFFYTSTGNGATYAVFLFKDGQYINGFLGGYNNSSVPAEIQNMPDLTFDMNGTCADLNIDWNAITLAENTTANGGSDNGFIRDRDGRCGTWRKSSSQVQHTPGVTNGTSGTTLTGALTTAQFFSGCPTQVGEKRILNFDVTGFTGDANETNSFPVEVQLWFDYPPYGSITGDVYQRSQTQLTLAETADTFQIFPQNQSVTLVYKTVLGCFDTTVSINNSCSPLPVNFTLFTAARVNSSTVNLKWQTSTEQHNLGFAIERNTGTGWLEIVFIPTQAVNGNSTDLLTYHYSDLNSAKGITQYRIRQVDIDYTSRYSQIRAVRGEGQTIKTNVFPNPTNDGKVTVVFVDGNATRDITLMDMSGRVVAQMKGVTNNNIQLENLNPGMYSLRIVDRGTGMQAVEKIVVNKR